MTASTHVFSPRASARHLLVAWTLFSNREELRNDPSVSSRWSRVSRKVWCALQQLSPRDQAVIWAWLDSRYRPAANISRYMGFIDEHWTPIALLKKHLGDLIGIIAASQEISDAAESTDTTRINVLMRLLRARDGKKKLLQLRETATNRLNLALDSFCQAYGMKGCNTGA